MLPEVCSKFCPNFSIMNPWGCSPTSIHFNRPTPMIPNYRPPNVLLPTPPRPDTPFLIFSNWQNETAPLFRKRQDLLDSKKRISLTDFKKKLARWKALLEHSDSDNLTVELERLQQECTDPEVLYFMKRKIERYNRRKQARSKAPSVLPISAEEVLSRLDPVAMSEATTVPQRESDLIEVDSPTANDISTEKCRENLKKASKLCQNTIRVLEKLDQLRGARVNQLRGQGKLLPEEIDRIFEKKKASIMNELEITQKTINKLALRLENSQSHLVDEIDQSGVISDDEISPKGIPPSVNYVLFGSRDLAKNAKWSRFYSQSNRNFSDFVRIRSNWDKYMVQSDSIGPADDGKVKRHPPSLLPITWELPPSPRSEL